MSLALAAFAACTTLALASCNNNTKYVATDIASESNEEYAFAIGKDATKKTEILAAMDKVISEISIDDIVDYYTAIDAGETPSVSLTFADLSDNTGDTLQVYTNAEFPPFEYIADGKPAGVDIVIPHHAVVTSAYAFSPERTRPLTVFLRSSVEHANPPSNLRCYSSNSFSQPSLYRISVQIA